MLRQLCVSITLIVEQAFAFLVNLPKTCTDIPHEICENHIVLMERHGEKLQSI